MDDSRGAWVVVIFKGGLVVGMPSGHAKVGGHFGFATVNNHPGLPPCGYAKVGDHFGCAVDMRRSITTSAAEWPCEG